MATLYESETLFSSCQNINVAEKKTPKIVIFIKSDSFISQQNKMTKRTNLILQH